MDLAKPVAPPAPDPLALRAGYAVPPEAMDFVSRAAVEALTAEGGKELEARRSLAEMARLVGEVLRRARERARVVVGGTPRAPSTPRARARRP